MQWLIVARDATDAEAPNRRRAARQAHLEIAARLQADGHPLVGGAPADAAVNMSGRRRSPGSPPAPNSTTGCGPTLT